MRTPHIDGGGTSPRDQTTLRRVDLRLAPAALGTWLAAGVSVSWPVAVAVGAGAVVAVAAIAVALREVAASRSGARSAVVRRPRHRAAGVVGVGAALALAAGALCLVVVAAGGYARGSGWWGDLVRAAATVRVEAIVRADPVAVRARSEGGGHSQVRVLVDVRHVTGRGSGASAAARVLVLGPPAWSGVAVGERVGAVGRLAATDPGDDVAALLVTASAPETLAAPSAVARGVAALRQGLLAASADLSPDARGLVPGLAVGDTSRLPAGLTEAMRAVSLTHLTAVSGAHVAIVLATVFGLTGWLPRGWRAGAAVVALVAFVLLVHPSPSVLRAAVMGGVAVLGVLLGRPGRAAPALAFAVIVLVLLDPWIARSFAFALSVVASAGLVLLAPPLAARLSRSVPTWLAHAIAVPTAAQVVCGPIVVLLAPSLSLLAVPANVVVAPAVPPATLLGVLATVLGPWWPAGAAAVARGAGFFAAWIAGVARFAADVPGARVPWPAGVGGALLLGVVSVGGAAALVCAARHGRTRERARARRLRLAALLGVVVVVVAALPGPRLAIGRLLPGSWPPALWSAVVCDVGQGATLAVRSADAAAVVVDAGPPGDAARRCLDALGIRRIDLLVLTHLHDDHVGGLAGVLAGRDVRAAIVGPYGEPAAARAEVADLLASAGVPVATPSLPDDGARPPPSSARLSGVAGSVRWEVVSPTKRSVAAARGADGTTVNDLGLAVVLRAEGLSVLALGDVESEAQARLAAAARRARAGSDPGSGAALDGIDVVLVAHHGSARQDQALARLVAAPLAVISVGTGNDYGHPSPWAIDTYERAGAVVLRTDTCGAIAVLAAPLATVSGCGASRNPGRRRDR